MMTYISGYFRILRGRALYKVTCDFVDAAVKGAVGVINRCIPPINPTDRSGGGKTAGDGEDNSAALPQHERLLTM